MNGKMTESLTTYERACSQCLDTMYHIAYVVFADIKMAETVVTKVCVLGAHKYSHLNDADKVKNALFSDLYRRCKRKLWFYRPDVSSLPVLLQTLTSQNRLLLGVSFLSGLSHEDISMIVGVTEAKLMLEIIEICSI